MLQAYCRLAVPFTLVVVSRPFAVSWNCWGVVCDACCTSYCTSAGAQGMTGRVNGIESLDVASLRVYRLSWSKVISIDTLSLCRLRIVATAARTTSGASLVKIIGVCPGTKPSGSPNVDWGGVYGASVDCLFQISVPGQIGRQHTREDPEKDVSDMESEEGVTGKSSSRISAKECSRCSVPVFSSVPGLRVDVDE